MDKPSTSSLEQHLSSDTLQNDKVAVAPVKPTTDVKQLARNLADHSRSGARIVMYPADPFN